MDDKIILTALAVFFAAIFIASRWQTLKERRANPQPKRVRGATDYGAISAGCGWIGFIAFLVIVVGALLKIGWNLF